MENITFLNSFAYLSFYIRTQYDNVWMHIVSDILFISCVLLLIGNTWYRHRHNKRIRKISLATHIVLDLFCIGYSMWQWRETA